MEITTAKPNAYSRLSCRVSSRIKQRAEAAASLLGQSMTDFTEAALADKAQAVLERHDRIELSERDFRAFLAAIETPAAPTKQLRDAMADYRRLKELHPDANL